MQDNGPLIALIFFILLSGLFGVMAYQRHNELMGPPDAVGEGEQATYSSSKDALIKEERDKLEQELNFIEEHQTKIDFTMGEIDLQQIKYQVNDHKEQRYLRAYEWRRKLIDEGKEFEKSGSDLGVGVNEAKEKTAVGIRADEAQVREQGEALNKVFEEKKEKSIARGRGFSKELTDFQTAHRRDKDFVNSRKAEFVRQLTLLTKREVERAHTTNEADGKVIFADTIHDTVVIDLGTSQGVKNGYVFECFRMGPGEHKISKGYLQVRKADSTRSECMIVRKLVQLPKDPLSEYVASEPEEQYSPYQESGKQGFTAQPLSGRPKTVVTGMNTQDPIVVGDAVQNPFFKYGKTFTFYIAGDKTINQGVQQSAIAYDWPHIERVLKFYGCNVVQQVDLGVDYILAQKNPEDDEGFLKAKTLGIPVLYEWEVFRFLDQK